MGGRWSVGWRDVLLPGALAIGSALEAAIVQPPGWARGVPVEILTCALLVFRRRQAAVVAPLSCLLLYVVPYLGPQLNMLSMPIGMLVLAEYSLGRYTTLLRGIVGVFVVYGGIAVVYLTVDQRIHGIGDVLFLLALFFPPFVLGRIVQKMAAQREQLLRQQELIEREAARGERLRIARELHDVLAHSLSAMVVQAAAARDVVRADPEAAEAGLDAVADAGRSALAETGRLLHVLRDDADELALGPTPSIERLDALVADFRRRGLAVRVDRTPDASTLAGLPSAVGVTAYRIVQESLTNALRHSSDGTAELRIERVGDRLTITIANPCHEARGTGRRPHVAIEGSGLGIAGIAERVALFDGTVEHGVRGGRHVLRATLRTPDAAADAPTAGFAATPGRPNSTASPSSPLGPSVTEQAAT